MFGIFVPPVMAGTGAGGLSISSSPPGATILIDGYYEGPTPATFSNIRIGSHTITLQLAGYLDYQTTATVTEGNTASVSATLVPSAASGDLSISSSPSGATILIDGYNEGPTPATFTNMRTGSHVITLQLPGYQDYQTSVTVIAGHTAYVSATLVPSGQTQAGGLSISSSPPGATIYIDGYYEGPTPATFRNMRIGDHLITLQLPGYQDYQTSVTVTAGNTASVSATLTPSGQIPSGYLSINSTPPGATIYIDGYYEGPTPATFRNMRIGDHLITLQLPGYQDYQTSVTITNGNTSSVSATMMPSSQTASGYLSIRSSPPGATILIDGYYEGPTPATFRNMRIGDHSITLQLPGYQDYQTSVTITNGNTSSVSATLIPSSASGGLSITSFPPGATILIDGYNEGPAPASFGNIRTGNHIITLQLAGYQDYQTSVLVIAGHTASVSATLTPLGQTPSGYLSISSLPRGATIFIDGYYEGPTPATFKNMRIGHHTITLKLPGYQDYQASVTIVAGDTASVIATLVPLTGLGSGGTNQFIRPVIPS